MKFKLSARQVLTALLILWVFLPTGAVYRYGSATKIQNQELDSSLNYHPQTVAQDTPNIAVYIVKDSLNSVTGTGKVQPQLVNSANAGAYSYSASAADMSAKDITFYFQSSRANSYFRPIFIHTDFIQDTLNAIYTQAQKLPDTTNYRWKKIDSTKYLDAAISTRSAPGTAQTITAPALMATTTNQTNLAASITNDSALAAQIWANIFTKGSGTACSALVNSNYALLLKLPDTNIVTRQKMLYLDKYLSRLTDTANYTAARAAYLTNLLSYTVARAGYLDSLDQKISSCSRPAVAQTITAPADMALNSTVAKAANLTADSAFIRAARDSINKYLTYSVLTVYSSLPLTGADAGVKLSAYQTLYAPSVKGDTMSIKKDSHTAINDSTGHTGGIVIPGVVTLATSQPNYAPAKAKDTMSTRIDSAKTWIYTRQPKIP